MKLFDYWHKCVFWFTNRIFRIFGTQDQIWFCVHSSSWSKNLMINDCLMCVRVWNLSLCQNYFKRNWVKAVKVSNCEKLLKFFISLSRFNWAIRYLPDLVVLIFKFSLIVYPRSIRTSFEHLICPSGAWSNSGLRLQIRRRPLIRRKKIMITKARGPARLRGKMKNYFQPISVSRLNLVGAIW